MEGDCTRKQWLYKADFKSFALTSQALSVSFCGRTPAVLYHCPNKTNASSAFFCSISFYFLLRHYNIVVRSDHCTLSHCSVPQVPQLLDYTAPSVKTRISILFIHTSRWTANHYKITLREEEAFKMPKKWNLEGQERQSQKEMRCLPAWGTSLWNSSRQQRSPPSNKKLLLLRLFL